MDMGNEFKIKADIFSLKNIPVHVVTKQNDWYNGYIKEVSPKFIIIKDRKHGESLLFYKDIFVLEQYRGKFKENI